MLTEYSFSVLAIALYNHLYNNVNTVCIALVLDIRNQNSFWKLPGGGVDEGEQNIVAILRELQQETGLNQTSNLYLSGSLDKSNINKKHVQHCFALEVLNLDGLRTRPVRDGHELLITGIFPIKYVHEAIITNSTIDVERSLNCKDIKHYCSGHSSKVFTPHANFIYQSSKLLFGWE